MHHAELTESVRRLVAATFAELQDGGSEEARETLLIRGGMYCGRRYDSPNGHALWFFEEDQIKLFSGEGRVLRVFENVSGAVVSQPRRLAA